MFECFTRVTEFYSPNILGTLFPNGKGGADVSQTPPFVVGATVGRPIVGDGAPTSHIPVGEDHSLPQDSPSIYFYNRIIIPLAVPRILWYDIK